MNQAKTPVEVFKSLGPIGIGIAYPWTASDTATMFISKLLGVHMNRLSATIHDGALGDVEKIIILADAPPKIHHQLGSHDCNFLPM